MRQIEVTSPPGKCRKLTYLVVENDFRFIMHDATTYHGEISESVDIVHIILKNDIRASFFFLCTFCV